MILYTIPWTSALPILFRPAHNITVWIIIYLRIILNVLQLPTILPLVDAAGFQECGVSPPSAFSIPDTMTSFLFDCILHSAAHLPETIEPNILKISNIYYIVHDSPDKMCPVQSLVMQWPLDTKILRRYF